jgi:glycosyltransferase involved in cell wall biosynthesis
MNCKNENEIKVSICVITYNHQNYIEECLNSLISQKTDFTFEIVIRDDNSTDGTFAIIKKYAEEYPKLINLLNSDKNLGMNTNFKSVADVALGDYIAICEGDDFWLNSHKLQIQYDFSKKNTSLDFFVHACHMVNEKSQKVPQKKHWFFGGEQIDFFDSATVLKFPGQFAATASYFFKRSVIDSLPQWFDASRTANGDFFIEMYASKKGGMYSPLALSAYRISSEGSYSQMMNKADPLKKLKHVEDMLNAISQMQLDFPELKDNFNLKISALHLTAALCYLSLNDFKSFQQYVVPIKNNYVSKYHRLLAKFRYFNLMVKVMSTSYVFLKKIELFLRKNIL